MTAFFFLCLSPDRIPVLGEPQRQEEQMTDRTLAHESYRTAQIRLAADLPSTPSTSLRSIDDTSGIACFTRLADEADCFAIYRP